ncbi:MAG: NlpC/P60 family protein [Nitrospiraceae bacterium]|nr:NlpC/P60 family protein [Nitrospiraceae bacterium]
MIFRLFFSFLFTLVIALPAGAQEPVVAAGSLGIVSVPLANVRDEAEPKATIVTQVLLAEEVRILEKRDYRYRIAVPGQSGRTGWIQQEAVLVPKDKGRFYLKSEREWIVIAVPKTPALVLDRLGNNVLSLYAGTRLPVLERTADGVKVQFPDRTVALITAADIMPVSPHSSVFNDVSPAEVAKTARKFIGVRYLAGGMTAQGMDTQGLITVVYRIHGYDLDLERDALAAEAVKVAKKDLQPGDILQLSGAGYGLVAGNGQFLYAPKKSTVQLAGMNDRRFAGSILYGFRVLGEDPEQKKRPAEMAADEIMVAQTLAADLPLGKRIAWWAGRFIGTPYDPDPLGLYVRTKRIVADEKADCMYHVFRSVELAKSTTPGEAIEQALKLRFTTEGKVTDGLVQNYNDRYEYGEDMVYSGKFGRNITDELGATRVIKGSRGRDEVIILPKSTLSTRKFQKALQDGDIIYWVKDPKRRVVEEIVAHLSVIHIKDGKPFLIHASGTKDSATKPGGGLVKELPLSDYLRDTKFIGAYVTRFEQ